MISSGHSGLLIRPYPADPDTGVRVDQINEITLLTTGGRNQVGVQPDAPVVRVTNIMNQVVSTVYVGSNGLDTGVVKPGTDYYLWVISDGTDWQIRLSTAIPHSWPVMPEGYIYGAACYWNKTDGNGKLRRIVKHDYEYSYCMGADPQVFNGMTEGWQWVPVSDVSSPTGSGFNVFTMHGGDSGKICMVGPDGLTVNAALYGVGVTDVRQVRVNGYMGGVYVNSNNPNFALRFSGATDTM